MNRRFFLKSLAASGMSAFAPSILKMNSLYTPANAAIDYAAVTFDAPLVMPQIINIYLYGGPSELAGNLTNIVDINTNSQNAYTNGGNFGSRIISFDDDGTGSNGLITPSGFWRGAGGLDMEYMLGQQMMSVYRTINKVKNPTRSHRQSILMNQKGSLDVDVSAGVGTRIASMLIRHRDKIEGTTMLADGVTMINDLTDSGNMPLPFVSFEGETRSFAPDPDFALPLAMRYLTMSDEFDNPYTRGGISSDDNTRLEAIVSKIRTQQYDDRFRGVSNGFANREELEGIIDDLQIVGARSGTTDTSGRPLPIIPVTNFDEDVAQNGGVNQIAYPDNRFTDKIRAAVTLAIENQSSMYITVGGGLGAWDDHNNGVDRYPGRMQDLFETLRAAMLHIKFSDHTVDASITGTPGNKVRRTDNIIINVFGDFGRKVNLNNSSGWDHGNNQNLFTFGGAGVRGSGALGKVIGNTVRAGDPGTNNQETVPAPGSYQAEPMSIASSVYSYFGAQNAELLTADDEFNPTGDVPLDESLLGETDLFVQT